MNNFNAIAIIVVSIIALKLVAIHFYLKTKMNDPKNTQDIEDKGKANQKD